MEVMDVSEIWAKYGCQCWARLLPQVSAILRQGDFDPCTAQVAAMAAARAFRLGFKAGVLVTQKQAASGLKIITRLN